MELCAANKRGTVPTRDSTSAAILVLFLHAVKYLSGGIDKIIAILPVNDGLHGRILRVFDFMAPADADEAGQARVRVFDIAGMVGELVPGLEGRAVDGG